MSSGNTVASVGARLDLHEAKEQACRDNVDRHDKELYGNGKTGLVEDNAVMKSELVSIKRMLYWLVGFGATTTVSALIGLIGAIIFWLASQHPGG